MSQPLLEQIVIVGPGLIGGSLGMAIRAEGLARRVVGVCRRQSSLDAAVEAGAVDEGTLAPLAAVPDADLIVLATGVGKIPEQAAAAIPHMKPGGILTDVGSVKGSICRAIEASLAEPSNPGVRFVGGHPLAGSEQRGISAARKGLFRGACCILTQTENTDRKALSTVRALWERVGCRVRVLPPDVHDRLVAEMSHLPHAAAACLVNDISDEALDLAATGFMDTTRVAAGDPELWRDICMANREALSAALRALATGLENFARELDAGNADDVAARLARAKKRRDARQEQ